MDMAMVGLGKMGKNMAARLLDEGHRVVVYNRSPEKVEQMITQGSEGVYSLSDLPDKLSSPRVVWLMLPAGSPTETHVKSLKDILDPGDIIVDGGNTFYKDDIRRRENLKEKHIRYADAGVSGGIWGLKNGYCLMIGGDVEVFNLLEPLFKSLASSQGYLYCGPSGAGHFVKMIHNGIEYGLMQAYAEGFEILNASPYADTLHPGEVAHLWNQGSVVRSWLLELAEQAFFKDEKLADISSAVADSGEGRWTVQQAIESGVSAPVIALSLFRRFESRADNPFSNRFLAMLRREFGGHEAK